MDENAFNEWAAKNVREPAPAEASTPAADVTTTPAPDATAAATAQAETQTAEATSTQADATKPADEAAAAAAATPKPDDAATAAKPEPKPDAAEGRHVSVAVHARKMSQLKEEHDQRVADLTQQLEEAKAKLDAKPTAKNLESFNALREKLKDEAPEFVMDILASVEGEIVKRDEELAATKGKLATYEAREREAQEAEAAERAKQRDEALAQVPVLKQWETEARAEGATDEAKERWELAKEHDRILRTSKAWAEKPAQERFAEALKRTAEDLGVELPKPEAASTTTKPAADPKGGTKAKPKADEVPASLSQVPTGRSQHAGGDSTFAAENLSHTQSVEMARKMTNRDLQRVMLGVR